jgi:hypothetical protein
MMLRLCPINPSLIDKLATRMNGEADNDDAPVVEEKTPELVALAKLVIGSYKPDQINALALLLCETHPDLMVSLARDDGPPTEIPPPKVTRGIAATRKEGNAEPLNGRSSSAVSGGNGGELLLADSGTWTYFDVLGEDLVEVVLDIKPIISPVMKGSEEDPVILDDGGDNYDQEALDHKSPGGRTEDNVRQASPIEIPDDDEGSEIRLDRATKEKQHSDIGNVTPAPVAEDTADEEEDSSSSVTRSDKKRKRSSGGKDRRPTIRRDTYESLSVDQKARADKLAAYADAWTMIGGSDVKEQFTVWVVEQEHAKVGPLKPLVSIPADSIEACR